MHYCNRGKKVFTVGKNCTVGTKPKNKLLCFQTMTDLSFLSLFRYNELNILFKFGFPVECLQVLRDWDYLCASCCS